MLTLAIPVAVIGVDQSNVNITSITNIEGVDLLQGTHSQVAFDPEFDLAILHVQAAFKISVAMLALLPSTTHTTDHRLSRCSHYLVISRNKFDGNKLS